MLFLNSRGSALPVPPPPADTAAPAADPAATANDVAAAEQAGAGADKAPNQAVLKSGQAAKGGQKNVGGDAAPVSQ